MVAMSSIEDVFALPARKLLVSSTEIDLSRRNKIDIFFLIVQESRGSAGGRGGGSGSRRVERIFGYTCNNGECKIIFDTSDESKIEEFEIPYSAVAMDIRLQDGNSMVVQGVVDPDLIMKYKELISKLSY
jgi:hypothetical protein